MREKKRGRLRGGRGGKDRRRRSARVVDPSLFYALRACVRAVLCAYAGRPLEDGLVKRLELWLEEADNWMVEHEGKTDVPVREPEPERRKLRRQVASSEGDRRPGVARHVVTVRKQNAAPSWPRGEAGEASPVEELSDGEA